MNGIEKNKTLFILEGIGIALLGMFAIAVPVIFTVGFELLIGTIFILSGIFQGFRLFKKQHAPEFLLSLLNMAVYLVIGALLIAFPIAGVLTLTLLLTFFFILGGIAKIVWGLKMRPLAGWGWLIASGIIALIMAAIIMAGWPGTALWVIGLLIGIDLVFFGVTLVALACSAPTDPSLR